MTSKTNLEHLDSRANYAYEEFTKQYGERLMQLGKKYTIIDIGTSYSKIELNAMLVSVWINPGQEIPSELETEIRMLCGDEFNWLNNKYKIQIEYLTPQKLELLATE